MSAKANYFKLGLFVLVGVTLGLAAILVLGAGKLFERKLLLETYFDQSVHGIDVGSKVKFRGVDVGRVRAIDFTRDRYQLDKPRTDRHSYVRVVAELRSSALGGMAESIVRDNLETEIERGLRVRLTLLGLTGSSYLDVDYLDPDRHRALPIDWTPIHPYVPSAPGAFSRIIHSLEDIVAELNQIDFQTLVAKTDQLLDGAADRVQAIDTAQISQAIVELIAETRSSNRMLQSWLEHPNLHATLDNAAVAMSQVRRATADPSLTNSLHQLERALRRLDQFLADTEVPLQTTLDNLRVVSEQMRDLTDDARRYPAHLFFGEPPKASRNNP